jgi:hypothetical protein
MTSRRSVMNSAELRAAHGRGIFFEKGLRRWIN